MKAKTKKTSAVPAEIRVSRRKTRAVAAEMRASEPAGTAELFRKKVYAPFRIVHYFRPLPRSCMAQRTLIDVSTRERALASAKRKMPDGVLRTDVEEYIATGGHGFYRLIARRNAIPTLKKNRLASDGKLTIINVQ